MNKAHYSSWAAPTPTTQAIRYFMSSVSVFVSMALALFIMSGMGNAQAALSITEASWNNNGTLTVKGESERGADIRVWNSFNRQNIGTETANRKGSWQIKTSKNNPPAPVPCAVSASGIGALIIASLMILSSR